ncbi:hypothetical protein [Streptomyces sp. ST2-7A]|uniref:hypothetical protein n=1 Tax=Streptomyces sp. ST2-7A TaxID=2907214 RepID=UPI001F267B77|nr:hypothetical protein [Streptomyces sp. ST2-7A]MCE7082776.1 hypothetical protein [Streptomyces sp. ST2-7A]
MTETTPDIPGPGTPAVDTKRDRVGVVMGKTGPYVQLRPEGGGREWDVSPEDLRPATTGDALRPKVRAANERSREARLCAG